MENEMILISKDGNEVRCEIIAKWHMDDSDYIAYTDGSMHGDELKTFISRILDNRLEDITDDSEWGRARDYLINMLEDDEDEY